VEREVVRRRRLPHWDVPGAAYFVTACLEGSIPAQGLLDIAGYRTELDSRPRPAGVTAEQAARDRWKRVFARVEQWLDEAPGVRWLETPALAMIVVDALYFFASHQYDLLSFVVMPSHVHWVFRPREEWVQTLQGTATPRERISKGRNQHTALECNRQLGRHGAFWQHESYDHWIRDAEEMERIILYIEGNPVKAGLAKSPEDWQYSSAHDRKIRGLQLGEPLRR
jgi:type I restriction enzyme R subunit